MNQENIKYAVLKLSKNKPVTENLVKVIADFLKTDKKELSIPMFDSNEIDEIDVTVKIEQE